VTWRVTSARPHLGNNEAHAGDPLHAIRRQRLSGAAAATAAGPAAGAGAGASAAAMGGEAGAVASATVDPVEAGAVGAAGAVVAGVPPRSRSL